MEISEKLEKEQQRLAKLQSQKAKLDEKINRCKNEIQKCNDLLHQKRFNEAEEVLKVSGISMDEVLEAIKKGDISNLQGRLNKATETAV